VVAEHNAVYDRAQAMLDIFTWFLNACLALRRPTGATPHARNPAPRRVDGGDELIEQRRASIIMGVVVLGLSFGFGVCDLAALAHFIERWSLMGQKYEKVDGGEMAQLTAAE
jgi:hypothetical protein